MIKVNRDKNSFKISNLFLGATIVAAAILIGLMITQPTNNQRVGITTTLSPPVSKSSSQTSFAQISHFHPKGKLPSTFTVELQNKLRKSLPFEDERDFDEASRGFIAAPDYKQIMAEAGHVAWDIGSYEWLVQGKDFDSIHPSLQRQAVLNMAYGLYEVLPGKIYQVRGYDLANISFIKSKTGWIVFDPLTAKETAEAALKFINEQLGNRPVVAVIYSHSHADHFGGVRANLVHKYPLDRGSLEGCARVLERFDLPANW
jgi:alkyl sulfatase BDS1-like metallo-beta-lactamase superfamily hydrolase